jgi:hypothetical protein
MSSYFVDEYQQKEIPPIEKWPELSFNELIEMRTNLLDRQLCFERNPQLWKLMQQRIELLSNYILERSQ